MIYDSQLAFVQKSAAKVQKNNDIYKSICHFLQIFFAESEGFEPPVRRNAYTAFRVRHFRPLSQLSPFLFRKAGAKVLLFFDMTKYFCKKMLFALYFVKTGTKNTSYIGDGHQCIGVDLMHDAEDERTLRCTH